MKSIHFPIAALVAALSLVLFAGCGNKKAPAEPVAVKAEPAAAPGTAAKAPLPADKAVVAAAAKKAAGGAHEGHDHEGHDHAGHDHAGHDHAGHDHGGGAAPGGPSGKVLESLDAGTYTYLRIASSKGEIWAAVPATDKKVGDMVALAGAMEMKNFKSKTLDREFPSIWFGTLATGGAAHGAAAPAGNPAVHGAAVAPAAKSGADRAKAGGKIGEAVPKAEGADAVTVAELWAKRKELAGKKVSLRGKVVRYSANIMGSNWMHLQDGSGSAADKTHDVTATSKATAKVGDVVLVSGVVAIDRNIGAGYNYPVLIEDAAVSK